MPSTILADNGVTSGIPGVKSTGAVDGLLALQTTTAGGAATTALSISATQIVTLTNALPVGSGGTGLTSPGTSGNALVSNGTAWTSGSVVAFPATTAVLFAQTAAPTGWTKSVTHDNKALRVVSGTASSGGTVAFTTCFANSLSAAATTLSTSQIPAHTHGVDGGGNSAFPSCGPPFSAAGSGAGVVSGSAGGGGSHGHTLPNFAVQYVDVIIATKD
jgi:hypothetical protein